MGMYILLKFVDVFISVFAPEYLSLVDGVLVVLGRCMPPRFFTISMSCTPPLYSSASLALFSLSD